MELVSALYVISFPEEYLQPVKLRIQHCVYLKSSQQFKYLSFIIAPIDESVPPYKFQYIEGGKFYTDSQYGMIVRSKFCIMGIGKKINGVDPHISFDDTDSETQSTSEHADVQSTDNDVSHTDSSSEDQDPPSSDSDNEIQSTSEHGDVQNDVSNTDSSKDTSSDTENETQCKSGHVDDPSTDNNTEEHPSGDTDDKTLPSSGHVGVQSTESMETNKNPGNYMYGDNETPTTIHSVSVGVQVPNDDDTPDNIYTGEVYYERTSSNKWLMRFMTVQNIKVFQQYIKEHHCNAVQDEIIRFSFLDPVNGYIQLIPDKQQDLPHTGWKIMPHKNPLVLTKRDADLFGSQHIPFPPSCLMTIRAKAAPDTEEDLSYAVPLKGIESDLEIYINRSLETGPTSHPPLEPTGGVYVTTHRASSLSHDTQNDPLSNVCHCVLGIDDLSEVFDVCKLFSTNWKFIGLKLGIKKTTLDNIKKDCDDVKERMLEMLALWLKRENTLQPKPSWHILLKTLPEYDSMQTTQIANQFVCEHGQ